MRVFRDEETPERTAFGARAASLSTGLDRGLFEAIGGNLDAEGAGCEGDAHRCDGDGPAAKGDQDAAWARHRTQAPAHGFKAHIAADKDSGLIRKAEATQANQADVSIAPSIIPDTPGEVYADRAMTLCRSGGLLAAGGTPRLSRKGHRWLPERLEAHNRPCVRSAPGSRKSRNLETRYRFRNMRWLGLPRPNSRSISPPLPPISNATGASKPPEQL